MEDAPENTEILGDLKPMKTFKIKKLISEKKE